MNKQFILLITFFLFFWQVFPASLWAMEDFEVYNRQVVPKDYQRIASLAPSITEILFALGLGDRIIGVTKHCDYPAEARTKVNVGSYIDLNIEKILALKPDLVIATADGNEKESVERLAVFKIPVLITNPKNLDGVFETVKTIGRITKQVHRAEIMVRSLKRRADQIIQACLPLSRPRVFLQINEHPLITVGKDTFHHHLITLAGGINISGNDLIKYPKYSLEQVIRSKPDGLLITSMERGALAEKKKDRWRQWGQIPAVKLGRIHILDSDLLDRPSPRLIDGLEALAKAIHPELGKN
ncbi:MAG: cobalamin-binding protein [Deltaproteobacteria bacterium]|nr:cobalamin-binding protein [Deltaproteobacteria bacterium]